MLALLAVIWCDPTVAADPDVVVVRGTQAGITASVSAARLGRRVTRVASEDHIGGILANGPRT